MEPLIITAAPFGPEWLPGDADIPVTWDEQVQAAVDCYNAGATMLHVHVRDPATGQGSSNFDQYNYSRTAAAGRAEDDPAGRRIDLVRAAHGGSEGEVARLRHPPHADRARSEAGVCDDRDRHDPMGHHVRCSCPTTSRARISTTIRRFRPPGRGCGWTPGPAFYLEHLKRLAANKIQPYFVPGHVHQLEIIERLIRAGVYMGPLNLAIAGYGGGTLGRNPFHWMDFLRQVPQGARLRPSGRACAA